MKNIVIFDEYSVTDLKSTNLLKEYISLLALEDGQFFPAAQSRKVVCPACGEKDIRRSFFKFAFVDCECAACLSLYVSPRPSDAAIDHFYKTSKARAFWNERSYSSSAPRRQEKIIKPRFQWMEDSTQEYFPKARKYADVNTNQRGYLARIAGLSFASKTLLNPLMPLTPADVPAGLTIANSMQGNFDMISLFETLDHTSDVAGLFGRLRGALSDGGLCFITGILASGFAVKVLGEQAANIYPPDRLNVFSVEGIKKLIDHNGFECLELSTPGILDVDLVAKALCEDAKISISPFLRDLVLSVDTEKRRSFQEFLQANLLSSYGRILIRKI